MTTIVWQWSEAMVTWSGVDMETWAEVASRISDIYISAVND